MNEREKLIVEWPVVSADWDTKCREEDERMRALVEQFPDQAVDDLIEAIDHNEGPPGYTSWSFKSIECVKHGQNSWDFDFDDIPADPGRDTDWEWNVVLHDDTRWAVGGWASFWTGWGYSEIEWTSA